MKFKELPLLIKDSNKYFLYRYMSEDKLAFFLKERAIYLTRMDRFKDALEGATPYEISELAHFLSSIPESRNNNIPEDTWTYIKESSELAINEHKAVILARQKERYVSSWYLGLDESYAMWELYAQKGYLIRIPLNVFINSMKDSFKKMRSAFDSADYFVIGEVRYQGFEDMLLNERESLMKFSAFRKSLAFKHEDEYRVVLHTKKGGDSILTPIADKFLNNLRIFASPYFSDSEYERRREYMKVEYSRILQQSNLTKWIRFKDRKPI
tara:strand:+ start:2379 stop:3182 length:804 start_codon:yes stop_codon:yes gene_type:complete